MWAVFYGLYSNGMSIDAFSLMLEEYFVEKEPTYYLYDDNDQQWSEESGVFVWEDVIIHDLSVSDESENGEIDENARDDVTRENPSDTQEPLSAAQQAYLEKIYRQKQSEAEQAAYQQFLEERLSDYREHKESR